MSLKCFRFYLAESEFHDEKNNLELLGRYRLMFDATKDFGFIRASCDLISTDKSISILCESTDDIKIENARWRAFLEENNIILKENMEYEVLQDEEHLKISCMHGSNCSHKHDDDDHAHHEHHHVHHESHWLKAGIGLASGLGLLILSVASLNIPMIGYYIITGFSSLVTLYLGYKVYQSAWDALKKKKSDMSTLYTISTLVIIGVSIAGLFIPSLAMMFESAPLILGFWHLGEAIEHTLLDKINKKLDIRDCASKTAVLKDGTGCEISVNQLIPNDIILIKSGEVIPIDGVLTQPALLYTTRVDGSPYLKHFNPGDIVKAGMCLANHLPQIEMRVTKTHQNSYLSLIAKNINKANDEKAPIELFANKVLKYFVPILLSVALVSGVCVSLFFTPSLAIQCVISVLVSACPCVLSMITPMAVRIGMKKASEHGVHYKDGKTLQAASDIDTVVFDLNGTLTQGDMSINSINIDDKNIDYLKYFALLEGKSDHPVSIKIKKYIEEQNIVVDESLEVSALDTSHHSGVKGIIAGDLFMIGNKDMFRANGVNIMNQSYDDVRNNIIYMARNNELVGQIFVTDHLRSDAITTVKTLQLMGKKVHICTGSDLETAERYAKLLGIYKENICANTVGTAMLHNEISKDSYIRLLREKGMKVAMVGDAANDLTAIASADMGIAVKSNIGDKFTEQHAGMVIQQGLLFPIATAFDIASKTKQNIFQNLFVSLTYNSLITLVASGLFIALGFVLNPVIGVAFMVVESSIVLSNLYRLKNQETLTSDLTEEKQFDLNNTKIQTTKFFDEHEFRRQETLESNNDPFINNRGIYGFFDKIKNTTNYSNQTLTCVNT